MMCKHYNTPQGCSYGDKCQFAHGPQDLRSYNPNILTGEPGIDMAKNQKNILNYKIVKCKNWEKDGTCKYGLHCTFAHGDNDIRTKVENMYHMQPNIPMMYQMGMMDPSMMMPPQMPMINQMDPSQIQQMNQLMSGQIEPNQLMMGMNMNVNMNSNNGDNGIIGNGNNGNVNQE